MTAPTAHSIALVRHGETDWNLARRLQGRTEVPLNPTGRAQAAAAAELLREHGGFTSAQVVASPLGRAIETSQIIAAALGLGETRIDEALIERHFGEAEGMLVAEAQHRWPDLEVPGGEAVNTVATRSANAFAKLLTEHPGSIVIAHGAMLRLGLSTLCEVDVPRVLNAEVWLLTASADGPPRARSLGVAHPAV